MRIVDFEEAVKAQLIAKIEGPKIELLSGDLRAHKPLSPSELLVQYDSSSLDFPNVTVQRRRWTVTIYVGARSLRAEGAHHGALGLIDDVRDALTGMRIPELGERDAKLYSTGDRFLMYQDTQKYWWYTISFTANGAYAGATT